MNNNLFKNKYRISPARLANWDYGSNGSYFITICTENRIHYFGDIIVDHGIASLRPTEIGKVAIENWKQIPQHFPFIKLDEFVIMPDHMHGILAINKPDKNDWQPNRFGVQSQNLGSVIRGYKASVKSYATIHNIKFAWQAKYHDHVIRNERELRNIKHYILQNPLKWIRDKKE